MSVLSSLKPTGSGRSRKMAKRKKKAVTKKRKRAVTSASPVRKRKKRKVTKTTTMAVTPTKRKSRVKRRSTKRRSTKRSTRRVSHIYRGNVNLTRLGGAKLNMATMQKFLIPAALLFGGAVLFRIIDKKIIQPKMGIPQTATATGKFAEKNAHILRAGIATLLGGGIAFASKNDKLQLLGFGIAAGGLVDAFSDATLKVFNMSGGSTRVLGGGMVRNSLGGGSVRKIGGDNPFRINGGGMAVGTQNTFPTAKWHTKRNVTSTDGKSNDFPV